jgi:hypothetical protein
MTNRSKVKRTNNDLQTIHIKLTTQVQLVEYELSTLPEHLSSPTVFSGIRVTWSLCVCFVEHYHRIKCHLFTPWYCQTIAELELNNNSRKYIFIFQMLGLLDQWYNNTTIRKHLAVYICFITHKTSTMKDVILGWENDCCLTPTQQLFDNNENVFSRTIILL